MAQSHLEVLTTFEDVALIALANRGEERRTAVMEKYGVPRGYDDFRRMIDKEALDCALVLVSIENTVEVASYCLRNGLPVLIEKPPGLKAAETRRLIQDADVGGSIHMVGLNRRFYSNLRSGLELIRERGPIVSMVVEAPELFERIKDSGKYPAGILARWLFANGIHCLDFLPFIGGDIKSVTAHRAHWTEPLHPDSLHALVQFESRAVGHYISNWRSPGNWALTLFGQSCRIELRPLEVGVAFLSSGEKILLTLDDADQRFKPGIHAQDRFFVDVCLGKRQMGSPAASLREALVTMELAEALLGEVDWIPR